MIRTHSRVLLGAVALAAVGCSEPTTGTSAQSDLLANAPA